MEIDINELAPWVAIAVTLILSILVPLFTQIANNRFQLKITIQNRISDEDKEKRKKKTDAYERFLMDVGGAIQCASNDNLSAAGASIGRLYLYIPNEWYPKLDSLYNDLRQYHCQEAERKFEELAKLISEEYAKVDEKSVKKK